MLVKNHSLKSKKNFVFKSFLPEKCSAAIVLCSVGVFVVLFHFPWNFLPNIIVEVKQYMRINFQERAQKREIFYMRNIIGSTFKSSFGIEMIYVFYR